MKLPMERNFISEFFFLGLEFFGCSKNVLVLITNGITDKH